MNREFENYKKNAIIAAIELYYSDKVIEKIKAAKNEYEISRIMQTAREETLK